MTASYSLIPVLFFIGGALFVGWGVRTRRSVGLVPEDWSLVQGTIVDASRPQRIEYTAPDGRRLRLQGTLSASVELGASVGVLVDPADPTRARLVDSERAAARLATGFLVLGVVLIVLGVPALVAFG